MYKNNVLKAKKHGNWRFLCNFVGMKQNLPDIIKENKDLQKVLLKQEGGIMKFLAEHLDVRGSELFRNYQDQCDAEYFENHEWDFGMTLSRDEMRCKALGKDHIESELGYLADLKTALSGVEPKLSNLVITYAEKYLTYAYNEKRKRNFPNGMTPREIYEEVMGIYRTGGLANDCMKIVLIEHNSPGIIEETPWYRNTMFNIRMKSSVLGNWRIEPDLRQAVADMLDGKTSDECRYLAVKMMKEVKEFSQMLYSKNPMAVTYLGFGIDEIKVDKEWLRDVAIHAGLNEHNKQKKSARYYFSDLVFLLMQIGRIWAAQLLANHSLDMHDLEVETDCILKPAERGDYDYYVDKLIGDSGLSQRFVVDEDHARKLLSKIKPVESIEEETQTEEECDESAKKNKVHVSITSTSQDKVGCKINSKAEQPNTQVGQDTPPPPSAEKKLPLPENVDGIRPQKYFKKAINKENPWIIQKDDGKYEWVGLKKRAGKPLKVAWAYFCAKVYDYDYRASECKAAGHQLPAEELEDMFDMNKGDLRTAYNHINHNDKTMNWMDVIDQFFSEE